MYSKGFLIKECEEESKVSAGDFSVETVERILRCREEGSTANSVRKPSCDHLKTLCLPNAPRASSEVSYDMKPPLFRRCVVPSLNHFLT